MAISMEELFLEFESNGLIKCIRLIPGWDFIKFNTKAPLDVKPCLKHDYSSLSEQGEFTQILVKQRQQAKQVLPANAHYVNHGMKHQTTHAGFKLHINLNNLLQLSPRLISIISETLYSQSVSNETNNISFDFKIAKPEICQSGRFEHTDQFTLYFSRYSSIGGMIAFCEAVKETIEIYPLANHTHIRPLKDIIPFNKYVSGRYETITLTDRYPDHTWSSIDEVLQKFFDLYRENPEQLAHIPLCAIDLAVNKAIIDNKGKDDDAFKISLSGYLTAAVKDISSFLKSEKDVSETLPIHHDDYTPYNEKELQADLHFSNNEYREAETLYRQLKSEITDPLEEHFKFRILHKLAMSLHLQKRSQEAVDEIRASERLSMRYLKDDMKLIKNLIQKYTSAAQQEQKQDDACISEEITGYTSANQQWQDDAYISDEIAGYTSADQQEQDDSYSEEMTHQQEDIGSAETTTSLQSKEDKVVELDHLLIIEKQADLKKLEKNYPEAETLYKLLKNLLPSPSDRDHIKFKVLMNLAECLHEQKRDSEALQEITLARTLSCMYPDADLKQWAELKEKYSSACEQALHDTHTLAEALPESKSSDPRVNQRIPRQLLLTKYTVPNPDDVISVSSSDSDNEFDVISSVTKCPTI